MTTENPAPATEKQLSFLRSLATERDIDADARAALLARIESGEVSKRRASDFIERLLAKPKLTARTRRRTPACVAHAGGMPGDPCFCGVCDEDASAEEAERTAKKFRTWPTIPDGRYALEFPEDELNPVRFFSVRTSDFGDEWDGFQRVKRHVSDDRFKVNGEERRTILDRIAEDPRAAAIRFGHETEHCCICGRELTRVESREAGIGPVCAGNVGW